MTRAHWKIVLHAGILSVLVGGYFVSQLVAQTPTPAAAVPSSLSLLDRWLSPDVVIGGVLVLLYAGELRGDIRRIKQDQKDLATRLHDDYIPRREVEALLGRRLSDRI